MDWQYVYTKRATELVISLEDLLSRTPDLKSDYIAVARPQYANLSDLSFNMEEGLKMRLAGDMAEEIAGFYKGLGYSVSKAASGFALSCSSDTMWREQPLFLHTYVQRGLGVFPNLCLAEPFPSGARFSQLCITYLISYALGMLVRYYQTHWIALINGGAGDVLWPTINRAQQYVESAFPELVAEYMAYAVDNLEWVARLKALSVSE